MSELYQLVIRQRGPKGIRPRIHFTLKGSQMFFNIFFSQGLEERQSSPIPQHKVRKTNKSVSRKMFSVRFYGLGDGVASFRRGENLGSARGITYGLNRRKVLKRCRAGLLTNQQTASHLSSISRSSGLWKVFV